jgi:hypothetical protein
MGNYGNRAFCGVSEVKEIPLQSSSFITVVSITEW